ncbi:hypothetical protein NMY22_g5374 [Coprinellus aureogranulatus]|nr:hypothetical protein NMY22_g5374 [Coprinellus aureogranulatus]
MGGGDRVSRQDSLFGTSPPLQLLRGTPSGSTLASPVTRRRGPRSLRRASPAPIPLSQYSTPSRLRSHTTREVGLSAVDSTSPIAPLIGRPTAAEAAAHWQLTNQTITADEAGSPFFAVAGFGGDEISESPVNNSPANGFLNLPFFSSVSGNDDALYPGESPQRNRVPEAVQDPSFSAVPTEFFNKCKFSTFNPDRPTLTNFDIISRFGQLFGRGITRGQLQQIFRRCTTCENLLYADRRSSHACDGEQVDVRVDNFDLVRYLLNSRNNSGLRSADFAHLTVICNDCKRYCLAYLTDFHQCPLRGIDD